MDNLHKVTSIAIVGGGTSAWLTAALLSNRYPEFEFTLIDKEEGNPVGVGEGTLLKFEEILRQCGFETHEWFHEVNATVKSGILFPGWGRNYTDVWHPFLFQKTKNNNIETTTFELWALNQDLDFKEYGLSFYNQSVVEDKIDLENLDAYAFHIDAGLLVEFLQKQLQKKNNINIIKSEVVNFDKQGDNIVSLTLKNNEQITSDLYIDCTGFKQLISKSDNEVTLEGRLFCDTAVTGHIPYSNKNEEMHPYVISEQVDQGWIWNIPTQTRIGSGLVFNRSITDIKDAKKHFCKYWNDRIKPTDLKVIDWTPYYKKEIWRGNVVSIGLSAGFIEPLESTGIALIVVGVEQLAFVLSNRYYRNSDIVYYNNLLTQYFEDAIDFVSMHYDNQERESKFWNWVKETYIKSEKHRFYEYQMQRSDRPIISGPGSRFFGLNNWICWLVQLGLTPSILEKLPPSIARSLIIDLHNDQKKRAESSPKHYEYIDRLKR